MSLPVPYVQPFLPTRLSPEDASTLHSLASWLEGSTFCECLDSEEYADEVTGHVPSCPRHHSARLRVVLQRAE